MRKIYEYHGNTVWCSIYDYTLDTVKEMESAGWKLYGTYCRFLIFYK